MRNLVNVRQRRMRLLLKETKRGVAENVFPFSSTYCRENLKLGLRTI